MNWKRLLASPPPNTGWVLDEEMAAAVRRERKGQVRCGVSPMPEGVVKVGPVGLNSVDRPVLVDVLRRVQETISGARRAAVVVPTAWVRAHILEVEQVPRRATELNELVQWRLKKLLPVRPSDLRIAAVPQPGGEGMQPVLVMVGLERALADLEAAFAEVGVEPGVVVPRLFALSADQREGHQLTIQQETGFLSMLLTTAGDLRLLRTKPLVMDTPDPWPALWREQKLVAAYARESLSVEGPIAVRVVAENEELAVALTEFWADQNETEVTAAELAFGPGEHGLGDRLGVNRLAPLAAILRGGVG